MNSSDVGWSRPPTMDSKLPFLPTCRSSPVFGEAGAPSLSGIWLEVPEAL